MIFKQLFEQLSYLESVINSVNEKEYITPVKYLGNATIGSHSRHIIEILQCAVNGYDAGKVDYYTRDRNKALENDKQYALDVIANLQTAITLPDKEVIVFSGNDEPVHSTYYREVVYNIEHTTHHLAMIKVGLLELGIDQVNEHLGFAYSTIQYKTLLNANKNND